MPTPATPRLTRVVPNEAWQLVLGFEDGQYRLFDAAVARREMGWAELAYPNRLKHLMHDEASVTWPGMGPLTAAYLHQNSAPLTESQLERQVLRLGFRNQAPTDTHPTHHVYAVSIFPFGRELFSVEESIGGGHAEMGGSRMLGLAELLAWPGWKRHFERAGADWAVPMVEDHAMDSSALSEVLVRAICLSEGAQT